MSGGQGASLEPGAVGAGDPVDHLESWMMLGAEAGTSDVPWHQVVERQPKHLEHNLEKKSGMWTIREPG